jgi:hypothetical protein
MMTNSAARLAAGLMCVTMSMAAAAQQPPVNSPLLDHLAGSWVLRGTIAGRKTTHSLKAQWVLGHHYLQIHELAREKNSSGAPQYEATIFVGMNDKSKQYSCIWLDGFWYIEPEAIGLAAAQASEIPFVWTDEKGKPSFANDFVYHPESDSWEWRMDNVENGVSKPFGRVTLTRQ